MNDDKLIVINSLIVLWKATDLTCSTVSQDLPNNRHTHVLAKVTNVSSRPMQKLCKLYNTISN